MRRCREPGEAGYPAELSVTFTCSVSTHATPTQLDYPWFTANSCLLQPPLPFPGHMHPHHSFALGFSDKMLVMTLDLSS